jgi:hypothetical protein
LVNGLQLSQELQSGFVARDLIFFGAGPDSVSILQTVILSGSLHE